MKEGCGDLTQENISECKESFRGFYSYIFFRSVYNKYPNMKGYLFLNGDIFFKPWDLENLDLNIPWMNFIRKHPNTSKPLSNYNYIKCFGSSDILNILVDLIYFPKDIMSKYAI